MKKEDGARFRKILVDLCRVGSDQVGLLFSGGTDSLTLLWSLLENQIKVSCYTFWLEDFPSTDSIVARRAADHWGANFVPVVIPSRLTLEELKADIHQTVQDIQSARKTHVEVMWGYRHLLAAVTEETVFSGLQADTLYGSSRSMAIEFGGASLETFAAARRKMVDNPDQEGFAQAVRLAEIFGKELVTPYTSKQVRDFMCQFTWKELHSPKQKMPAVHGFNREFAEIPIYRRNDNMQCGSGIREYIAQLLSLPVFADFSRVQGVYKWMLQHSTT